MFEDHFRRTSTEMEPWEWSVHNDPESDYSWERDGETVINIIANEADVSEQIAGDVSEALAECHSDFDCAAAGEECEFDGEAQYEEKSAQDHELRANWSYFRRSLKTEARLFNREAESVLAEVFEGLDAHATHKGKLVIVDAGLGREIALLFRARTFAPGEAPLEEALKRPDLEIGPPPWRVAKAGRMNARGISVFYGATDEKVAIVEVRPPVGSRVVVARFDLIKPLRLFDVEALRSIYVKGSLFDPAHVRRARFLQRLSHEIVMPVIPEDEPADYLVTQAIADYLAQRKEPEIDGIVYPSIQNGAGGRNVALFHKSSRWNRSHSGRNQFHVQMDSWGDEDDDSPDYRVFEAQTSGRLCNGRPRTCC